LSRNKKNLGVLRSSCIVNSLIKHMGRKLIHACRVMGITVHEHLIIGDNTYFSFADQGYIAVMNREYEASIRSYG